MQTLRRSQVNRLFFHARFSLNSFELDLRPILFTPYVLRSLSFSSRKNGSQALARDFYIRTARYLFLHNMRVTRVELWTRAAAGTQDG